jgi:peroxiredoxin
MNAAGVAAQPSRGGAGRLQTIAVIGITAVVLGALAFFVSGGVTDDGVTTVELAGDIAASAPKVGDLPPDFTAQTPDGETISLSDYAGKPLWLTFGATWCPDCRVEIPDVQGAYDANKAAGLQLLGVFIREPGSDIKGYSDRVGLTFPIVVDERTVIAAAYRNMGIPTHYFIGADGRIKEIRIGAMSRADMDRAIAGILE